MNTSILHGSFYKAAIATLFLLAAVFYSNPALAWKAGEPYLKGSLMSFSYDGASSGTVGNIGDALMTCPPQRERN